MRIPKESLDDFDTKADYGVMALPPPPVSPRKSGGTEVLKPLVHPEDFERSKAAHDRKLRWAALSHLSFYHRSIAVGGASAVIAFVFGMGIYFGFYAVPVEQAAPSTFDLANGKQKKRQLTPPKAPNPFDHLAVNTSPALLDEPVLVPAVEFKHRSTHPRAVQAVYRVRRVTHRPQLAMAKFIPTTLIIYVEKGEVKSRIEPQLTASYKKTITVPN